MNIIDKFIKFNLNIFIPYDRTTIDNFVLIFFNYFIDLFNIHL